MRANAKQIIFPVALILVGLGQLIYGVGARSAPVLIEKDGPPQAPPDFEPPPGVPFFNAPPPPTPEKLIVTIRQSELRLIREVSIGGITRLASGELKRTYTGTPPSLCPT